MKISIEKQDLKLLLLSDATKPIYIHKDDEGNLSLRGTDTWSVFDINVTHILDEPDSDPNELDVNLPYYFEYGVLSDINKLAKEKEIIIDLLSDTEIKYANRRFTNEPQISGLFHVEIDNYFDLLEGGLDLYESSVKTAIFLPVLSKYTCPEVKIVLMNNKFYLSTEEDSRKTFTILPLNRTE